MSGDTPHPVKASGRHESGKYERAELAKLRQETIADKLSAISETLRDLKSSFDDRLDRLDQHVRALDKSVTELREAIKRHDDLLDRLHGDYDRVHRQLQRHDERLDDLEKDQARREGESSRGALVASGAGVAGGGVLYGILELVRRLLG
jgi:chromosome segregation ATPase